MKYTTTLQFASSHELHEFIQLTALERYALVEETITLHGKLSEAELELAINGFSAALWDASPVEC